MNTDSQLYKKAGVDTAKGDDLVDWLLATPEGNARHPPGVSVLDGIGGFAGMLHVDFARYRKPILVASTDGVGTKLLLAIECNQLRGVGVDLVGMCLNDLYCVGARPFFFLDYFATGKLDETQFKEVLAGIKSALATASTVLLGGETAELPGLYAKSHFDLAGFVVGAVDDEKRIGAHRVKQGDALIALESSGFHSNGYSLIRYWLKEGSVKADEALLERLLVPTRVYAEIPELLEKMGVEVFHALANITGGGISGNVPRVLPQGLNAVIERKKLPTPDWMRRFIDQNGAAFEEVEGVFNLGAGMVAVVAKEAAKEFMSNLESKGISSHHLGEIVKGSGEARVVYE